MAKIHGLTYILIGLIIVVTSWITDRQKFILFVYTGLVFVIIGIVKLTFTRKIGGPEIVQNAPKTAQNTNIQQPLPQQYENTQPSYTSQHNIKHKAPRKPNFKSCLRCGYRMQFYDKYCSKCGARALR